MPEHNCWPHSARVSSLEAYQGPVSTPAQAAVAKWALLLVTSPMGRPQPCVRLVLMGASVQGHATRHVVVPEVTVE